MRHLVYALASMRAFLVGVGVFCPTTLALQTIDAHTHTLPTKPLCGTPAHMVLNRATSGRSYFDFHIPKTAGTSFLKDVCMVLPDGERYWSLERCLKYNMDYPAFKKRNGDEDVGFFREPLAHVYSQFLECKYSRWGKSRVTGSELVYVENVTTWLKYFRGGAESDDLGCYHPYNMQTRALMCNIPGWGGSQHYSEPSIDEALNNLNSLFFFGLTEHYQASLCLFHAKTHDMGSPLPAFCNCTNDSAWHSFPEHELSHGVPPHSVDDLSQEDKRLIEELTQQDAVLYREASKIFMREISEVERHFNVKLVC